MSDHQRQFSFSCRSLQILLTGIPLIVSRPTLWCNPRQNVPFSRPHVHSHSHIHMSCIRVCICACVCLPIYLQNLDILVHAIYSVRPRVIHVTPLFFSLLLREISQIWVARTNHTKRYVYQ